MASSGPNGKRTVVCKFVDEHGDEGSLPQVELPLDVTPDQLAQVLHGLRNPDDGDGDGGGNADRDPLLFFVDGEEVLGSLGSSLSPNQISSEEVLPVMYQVQALFRVRPVTRCGGSMTGHAEAVLSVAFAPDASVLASGGGDKTVRLWDTGTQTPLKTLTGHRNWVLVISWAPDAAKLASGGYDGDIRIWDIAGARRGGGGDPSSSSSSSASASSGAEVPRVGILGSKNTDVPCRVLSGHKKWINSISWEPYQASGACRRLVSGSKDASVRVWDVTTGRCVTMGGHTNSVTAVVWGGEGLIYSSSQDRTTKVWTPEGMLVRTLSGHAHWINHMALNTGHVLRSGPFDHNHVRPDSDEEALEAARKRRDDVARGAPERLVTGSDDFTCYLWASDSKKSLVRMTGHQAPVNHVAFSPDGRWIASGSFDKCLKLWNSEGRFVCNFRAHVQQVYQVAFSCDSRLLISASKDSQCIVWSIAKKKRLHILPGHADEVYSVDWCGDIVASGSKDKQIKLWRA